MNVSQRGFVSEVFTSIMDAVEWTVKRGRRGGERVLPYLFNGPCYSRSVCWTDSWGLLRQGVLGNRKGEMAKARLRFCC